MAASYPTSVKTFATRSAGQTISASHINDLQDEVNAIETGILNGSAPLTSSNTAVAALSVSGGSTFAGPVVISSGVTSTVSFSAGAQFSGASSFSGGVTVSGAAGLLVTGPVYAQNNVRLGYSTVTLAAGESTALSLSSAVFWVIQSTVASTAVTSTITGIVRAAKASGDLLILNNGGSPTVNLGHAGSSVTSTNQIACPNGATISLQTHESVGLIYDGSIWRIAFRADA